MRFEENLKYQVEIDWDGRSGGRVECENCGDLTLDTPREFSGLGRGPCPDQLFLAAVGGCLLTTFLHFRNRLKVDVEGVKITASTELALRQPEGYRIRCVKATMRVEAGEEDVDLARRCAELARDYCHITRSIEGSVPLEVSVEVAQPPCQ